MVVDTVYPLLKKYANKTETLHNVLQNVQFKLELVGIIYEEDRWLDVCNGHILSLPSYLIIHAYLI